MKPGDIWLHHPDGQPRIIADRGEMLLCNGELVSRKTYPLLYAAIGTAYCDEDARCCNAELFNLPNPRLR